MSSVLSVVLQLGTTRLRAGVTAALVGLLFLVPGGIYYARDHHGLGPRSQDAIQDLRLRATLAEVLIKQAMLMPGSVVAGQSIPINTARLEASVVAAFQAHPIVNALEIAPTEQAVAYFSRNNPAVDSLTADQLSKLLSKTGRVESMGSTIVSIQGDSIVATQPLGLRKEQGTPHSGGYTKAAISIASLARALRLKELGDQGYSVKLDYFERESTLGKALFALGDDVQDNPVINEIHLSQGGRITLSASLPASWNAPPIAITELFLLLFGGAFLTLLTYLLLRRPVETDGQVALRTLHLSMDKEMLRSEIEGRRQAELLLRNSHALLDSVFQHIPSMIVLKRATDLTVVRANRLAGSILGQSIPALLGPSNNELQPDEHAARDAETDLLALSEGNLVELPEQFIQTSDGAAHWVKIKKRALYDDNGKPSHVLVIGEDITVHKHLDAALTENLNFVEQLLTAIPSPIFFKDADGRYLGVNKAFEGFYGTTREAMVGKTVYDISPSDLAEIYDKADRELLKSGGIQTYETRAKCADGVDKDVIFFKAVFTNTHAEVGGIVGIALDVTKQKAAERHILRLNRTLSVIGKTNEAMLRAMNFQVLIEETVGILHEVGGFSLAWVYGRMDGLPPLTVSGTHPELALSLTANLRADADGKLNEKNKIDETLSGFFTSLRDFDPALDESLSGFELHGLAHLPLRVGGRVAGGICIVGLAEDLADVEEQRLLVSLAENLSHAIEALEQERARQLAESKLVLASHVFENSAEGVMITDRDNIILMVNRRFAEITGYAAEEVLGNKPNMLSSGQQDKSFYTNMWRSLMNRGEWHGEIRNRRKDGEVVVEWMNISVVKNDDGEIINYVGVFSEITVHKTVKKRLQFLAHYDALTSLPNRILFGDRFEQAIVAARRRKGLMALMLIDLDRFDQINKTVGHSVGDMLLQEVAQRLNLCVRDVDTVARLGGDEFAIILSEIDSSDQAVAAANRVQQELSRALYIQDEQLSVSASIGISIFPRDGDEAEALTTSADTAMYLAAEAGGNTYRFPQLNERLSEQVRLRDRLHRAIERDELKVFYQPLVSGETGRIVGAEALLRWFRPEAGFVSPDFFVPMLEQAGLAVRVGDIVLRTALADNMSWRKDFDSTLFVAVNFCADQIADERAVEKVAHVMKELAFDSRYLHLEISEVTLMEDAPKGLALLHRLKDLGIAVSMDNVGTGYSSISYLNRFPIDSIKIDRSFIQDTPNDAEAVAITRTIIAMGHALNLKIVAAGVETAGQLNLLRRERCDVMQGYRFSPGVSADEFAVLLAENQKADFFSLEPDVSERLHLVG